MRKWLKRKWLEIAQKWDDTRADEGSLSFQEYCVRKWTREGIIEKMGPGHYKWLRPATEEERKKILEGTR